jgi:D-alanyl-D-alanine dipeptidase
MKNNTILTYEDIKKVDSGSSNEELVDIRSYDNSITAQYEKFDMIAYTGLEIRVRKTVAIKLAAANKQLKAKYNVTLKVVYGYRALEVQTKYFNKKRDELRSTNSELSLERLTALTHNFVAVPEVAGHVTGGAVDITLVNSDGVVCDMGTKIADFTNEENIKTLASEITTSQKCLRRILLDEMMSVGFAPFLGEWWHFSYGDKEWAAYYKKPSAIYGPVVMIKTATILKIAGGDETVLQTVKIENIDERAGSALLAAYPMVEQAGFVDVDSKKLEMAGGEFCGNASTATAVLLANGSSTVRYSVFGFNGSVVAKVIYLGAEKYRVRTSFKGIDYTVGSLNYEGKSLSVMDMEGIVHILIEGDFPASGYKSIQRTMVDKLSLRDREAVGVIWYKQQDEKVKINPVVWVKKIDTLYRESACGSGAIATALCTNRRDIIQPTGECISVYIDGDGITTECEVKIITG